MKISKLAPLFVVSGAFGGAIGIYSLLMRRDKENVVNRGAFYVNAIKFAKENPVIVDQIGENITHGRAKIERNDSSNPLAVQVKIPLKGDKDSGDLYAYAKKKDKTDRFKLYKLEMTFDKLIGKKLVLMVNEDVEQIGNKPSASSPETSKLPEKKKTNMRHF